MSDSGSPRPDANNLSALPVVSAAPALALTPPQREQYVERLTRAFAEDALTMDEFERRAELVYSAATLSDLQKLVADLPAEPERVTKGGSKRTGVAPLMVGDRITTLLGSTERRMPAAVPRLMSVRTLLGNTELDFRYSNFEPGITEIHVRCLLGNVEITVPEGVRVELLCSNVLANVATTAGRAAADARMRDERLDPALAVQPVVDSVMGQPERVLRVTGRAMLANVEVHPGRLGATD